jgi:hypothetical protein
MDQDFADDLRFIQKTPGTLETLLATFPEAKTRVKPSDQEFSFLESVCHLRDIEIEGYGPRLRRILAEERPWLQDVDGARLAREREYNEQNLREALTAFVAARMGNVATLSRLDPSARLREGNLERVGTITLSKLVSLMRDHDEGHLDELNHLINRLHQ